MTGVHELRGIHRVESSTHELQRDRYRGRNVVERCFNKLKQ